MVIIKMRDRAILDTDYRVCYWLLGCIVWLLCSKEYMIWLVWSQGARNH